MSYWLDLEEFLVDNDMSNQSFSAEELAIDMGLEAPWQATRYIQAYLGAQAQKDSTTLFILRRTGRTKSAVWHVGVRTADAVALADQVGDDFARRLERYAAPSLRRIADRNPRARQTTEALTEILQGAAKLITAPAGEEDGQLP